MTKMPRRNFLAAGAAVSLAGGAQPRRIRIGQIGTGHAHAAGKMAALRKLTDHFEVVGVVEPGEASYQRSINVIWLIVFVAAVAVPFVFRRRFVERQRTDDP